MKCICGCPTLWHSPEYLTSAQGWFTLTGACTVHVTCPSFCHDNGSPLGGDRQ